MDKRAFIITGESSGELYGALLARSLLRKFPDVSLYGVGGHRMQQEGVHLLGRITGAFGITEAVSHLTDIKRNYLAVKEAMEMFDPQIVVLIDFPEFNLKVAELAKKRGTKVLYYVAPQVWAWRKRRVKKLKRLCDAIAVVLPFEEEFFRKKGVKVEFVGHPILEEIEAIKGGREFQRRQLGLESSSEVVALLPGSRKSELKRHLPLYREVVQILHGKYRQMQFVMPVAYSVEEFISTEPVKVLQDAGVVILRGRATEALSAADTAVVASGTATLQAALVGTPMVVVYRLFPLTYLIGRMIVDVRYISLVNLLLQKEVVKELIQWKATPETVVKELERTIYDDTFRQYMQRSFKKIRELYEGKRASERVAEMTGECAGW